MFKLFTKDRTVEQKIRDSVYGFAIADAVGVPYEFLKRDEFKCTNMTGCRSWSHHQVERGTWSDDTSLLLCVMDALCENEKYQYSKWSDNAVNWLYCGKFSCTNPPFDVGTSCHRGVMELQTGIANKYANDINSNGNGGIMRILPIAYLQDDLNDQKLLEKVAVFNKCSHNHQISHIGSLIYIKLIRELLRCDEEVDKAKFRSILKSICDGLDDSAKLKEYKRVLDSSILDCTENLIMSTGYVVHTLEAAIWCAYNSKSYKDSILKAVNLGGDTDTTAALTGGITGILYGIDNGWLKMLKGKEWIDPILDHFLKVNLKAR